jgi:hypothetical protein
MPTIPSRARRSGDVSRMLITCGTEVILHVIALIAGFDPAKARAIWLGRPKGGAGRGTAS